MLNAVYLLLDGFAAGVLVDSVVEGRWSRYPGRHRLRRELADLTKRLNAIETKPDTIEQRTRRETP